MKNPALGYRAAAAAASAASAVAVAALVSKWYDFLVCGKLSSINGGSLLLCCFVPALAIPAQQHATTAVPSQR